MNEEEEWRPVPVPEFDTFYEVSSLGRVRSVEREINLRRQGVSYTKPGQIMKTSVASSTSKYLVVTMRLTDLKIDRTVHTLVLEAFVGPAPDGHRGRHRNGDHTDNQLSNLYWASPEEVRQEQAARGRATAGGNNGRSRVTEPLVAEILDKHLNQGVTQKALAAEYGLHTTTVSNIANGKTWRRVFERVQNERG